MRLGNPGRRLRGGLLIVLVLFLAVAGRLIEIQTVDARGWAAQAVAERMQTVPVPAARGQIVDRNGAILADSVPARAVFADPKYVTDPASTAAVLSGLLGVPEATLEAKLTRTTTADGKRIRFVYLARGVDPEVGDAVMARNLPGINLLHEERREVPGHDLAANIIGFTGQDGQGLAGLEAGFNDVLAGKDGVREHEVGASGEAIPDGINRSVAAVPGRTVKLTLDRDVQYEAQRILTSRMRTVRGMTGSAIVMDVKTGTVYAMASAPTFDAADPKTYKPTNRVDLATGAVVEPGSIHKAITISAGLQTGVISPNTVLTLPRTITKGGVTFKDTHPHGTVRLTLQGILAQSSNVGTITVADAVGAQRLYEYQLKFGLGAKTGIGIPGESPGIVQPPKNWSGPSYGGIPIGLGVAVTPLQMASVYQTIANDGVRVPPRLVEGTVGPDGDFQAAAAPQPVQVVSAQNARALRLMLEAVPTKEGTARRAALPGYRVAGKTGTGQEVKGNKYLPGNVSSFIGMVPADAPRFVIAIFVHAPQGVGGSVAGPAFADLASFALRHFDVPPTGSATPPIRIYG